MPLKGSVPVSLPLFAGLVQNVSFNNVPAGASPSCSDVDFIPQEVFTRAALNKRYSLSLPYPILYTTTYNRNDTEKFNLFLDNQGNVYIEDVINFPYTYVLLMENLITPGDYLNCEVADPGGAGLVRAWFASFSGQANGLASGGSDIPTFFDGNNFTRVTQDGPADMVQVNEQVANIAINYITQPALIGPSSNAAPLNITGTTINFYQNTTGIYTGTGAQSNPNPIVNGTSLVFNQIIPNWPVAGYYGPSTTNDGRQSPVLNQQQDNFGNWTSDVVLPETAPGGSNAYGFDMNIQGSFVTPTGGNVTLYFQVDNSWILFAGNGTNFNFGPQVGSAASKYGYNYMASRLNNATYPGVIDTVVLNFPGPGSYPFEIGYSNKSTSIQSSFVASFANGNVATQQTQNIPAAQLGFDILPYPTGAGVTLSEEGNTVTAVLPTQHPFGVGDSALVQNFNVTQYNGIQQITSVPSKNSFTFESLSSGLAVGVGGTIAPVTATCVTENPHGLIVNDQITISNNTQNIYCTTDSFTSGNVTIVNPALWTVSGIIDPQTFQFNTVLNSGTKGTGGFIGGGGLISPGLHQICCSFLLDDGSITAPGPVAQWNSTGFKKFQVFNLPIGPPNTKGRILNITGAGGASFFTIPSTPYGPQNLLGGQTSTVPIGTSTVINDNTTTSIILDFADATLFTGTGIDITGNNLFNQITLAPSIGCIEYADRLFWWGEVNKVQNLINMGFNGGYNTGYSPLGWSIFDPLDSTLAYDNLQGLSYAITGNSSVNQQGLISQSAYQDAQNIAIVSPNTLYRFRAKLTPTNLIYSNTINRTLSPQYSTFENFSQSVSPTLWSRVDPNSNISLGTNGIIIDGGNGSSGNSYYQFNYPVQIPTTSTPGYLQQHSNVVITTNNYTPSTTSGGIDASASVQNGYNAVTNTLNLSGWGNVPTTGITAFTINFTAESIINQSVASDGISRILLSYDNGATFTQSLFAYNIYGTLGQYGPSPISVNLNNIANSTPNLDNLVIQVLSEAAASSSTNRFDQPVSGYSNVQTFISNITSTATTAVTTYTNYYETGNISVGNISLSDTSSGNLLTLYSQDIDGNPQIDPADVFIGFNIQPDIANSAVKFYINFEDTDTFLADVPVTDTINLLLTAIPSVSGNSNITTLAATVSYTNQSSVTTSNTGYVNVSDSLINNSTFNLIIADNANITGNILTAAITNWPVDITSSSPAALPSLSTANTQTSGTLVAQLFSPTLGTIGLTSINLLNAPIQGEFLEGTFNRSTGATIPSDTQLQIFAQNIPDGQTIALNDMLLIPDNYPVNETQLRVSYTANPTAYDDVTGKILLPISGEKIVTCFKLRDLLYIVTDHHIFETQDNGSTEPSGWTVTQLTNNSVGALGPFAIGLGRKSAFMMDRSGLHNMDGNLPILIGEEILPTWLTINWDYAHISWIYNDVQNRKSYLGIPTNGSTTVNTVFLINTRGLDPEYDISEPIHVSTFSGKLLASDKTIKFSPMSPALNYCAALNVDGSDSNLQTTFCGNYGNMYWLNSNKYTDDDYGPINSFYTTYFFLTPDQEESLQMSGRKLWTYLSAYITGVGSIQITPLLGNLNNPGIPLSLRTLYTQLNNDLEWNINQSNQRIAFKIQPIPNFPVTGSNTDASFTMTKFEPYIQTNPISSIRGAGAQR